MVLMVGSFSPGYVPLGLVLLDSSIFPSSPPPRLVLIWPQPLGQPGRRVASNVAEGGILSKGNKTFMTFHYTDWVIGILIFAYEINPI